MHIRQLTLSMLCLAGATSILAAQENRQTSRPNIVFILVDDLGYMDIEPNNPETFYETPNVSRLARRSMRFTDGYAACPVCSPTRSSIFTGKYPVRTGITDYINPPGHNQPGQWQRNTKLLPAPYRDRLDLNEITLAEALKEAGYATFFAGKWHLGPEGFYPENQGFDVNKGGYESGGPFRGNKYFSPYDNPRLADGHEGEHLPDRLAGETVRFIEDHRNDPFFACLSFYSVHTPLMARKDLEAKYLKKRETLDHEGPLFGTEGARQVRLVQEHAVYSGMVEAMDQAVGKVLDALDRLRLTDRTIVFFTSDNGGLSTSEGSPTSNVPLRAGKGWLYEGGIRVPLLIRWPGITLEATVCDAPVTSTDFYPTILDMAGLPLRPRQHRDGVSLVPLLKGERLKPRPLFWHYPHYGNQGGMPGGAVRDGDWKLIEWFEGRRVELYNLRDDLEEKQDLVPTHPEKVAQLQKMLQRWRERLDAKLPTSNPGYDPEKEPWK